MKKRVNLALIIGLIILMVLFIGCSNESEEKEEIEVNSEIMEANTIEAFGVIKSLDEKNIIIDFPGYVEKIYVGDGERISKGDTLLTINIDSFKREINNMDHELMIMKIESEKMEKNIYKDINKDPEVQKLLNDLNHTEELYGKKKKELEGQETLFREGAISGEVFEVYNQEVTELKKKVEDARYALEISSHVKEADSKELNIQNEKTRILENNINNLKDKLKKSYINDNNIVADIEDGVVSEISYKEGDIINPEVKLLSIIGLDNIIVNADIPEEFIKDVHMGSKATIVPLADKTKEYKGNIIKIDSRAIYKNGETIVPVEISIDNIDDFLLPNFNVDVTISIDK